MCVNNKKVNVLFSDFWISSVIYQKDGKIIIIKKRVVWFVWDWTYTEIALRMSFGDLSEAFTDQVYFEDLWNYVLAKPWMNKICDLLVYNLSNKFQINVTEIAMGISWCFNYLCMLCYVYIYTYIWLWLKISCVLVGDFDLLMV